APPGAGSRRHGRVGPQPDLPPAQPDGTPRPRHPGALPRRRPRVHRAVDPAGRSAIEAAAPNHVTTVRRFFLDPLSDDELDTLATLLDRLLAGLADTGD